MLFLLIAAQTPTQAQYKIITNSKKVLVSKNGVFNGYKKIPTIKIEVPSQKIDSLKKAKITKFSQMYTLSIPVDINIVEKAKCKRKGEFEVCRLGLELNNKDIFIEGGGFSISFNELFIPEKNIGEGQMYIYTKNRKQLAGPIYATNINTYYSKMLSYSIAPLTSNSVILEYKVSLKNKHKMKMHINHIQFTKNITNKTKNGQQGGCFIDINCPEGTCWHNINNLATAKLKNLSFAANEAHYLGIRVSNGTGKFDFNANSNIKLQITHESANNTPINASSACIFDIKFGKNDNNLLPLPNGLQATVVSNLVYNTLLLNTLSNEITEASICIYNTQGQLVKLNKKQVLQIGLNEQSFEVSNLPIGLYTIVIYTNKNVVSKKFIKL